MRIDADNAWIEGVRQVPSPNHDERPAGCEPSLLVIHGISVPAGRFSGNGVDALFTNRIDPCAHPDFPALAALRVSAHVLIRRDGVMTQFVPFTRRAWHAGESQFRGRAGCNDYSIGVELEGTDDTPYEGPQYAGLAALVRALAAAWPGISFDRIVGHCDIAPGRKTDPGPAFDWSRLHRLLGVPDRDRVDAVHGHRGREGVV